MSSGTVPCPVAARRSARLAEQNNNVDRAIDNTIAGRSSEVYQTPEQQNSEVSPQTIANREIVPSLVSEEDSTGRVIDLDESIFSARTVSEGDESDARSDTGSGPIGLAFSDISGIPEDLEDIGDRDLGLNSTRYSERREMVTGVNALPIIPARTMNDPKTRKPSVFNGTPEEDATEWLSRFDEIARFTSLLEPR